jgi:hypothetical protein
VDLAAYRAGAEEFASALDLEYLLHFSGRKETFDLEPIYERHAGLVGREAAEQLREAGAPRELVRFAVEGLIGLETRSQASELARREATLTVRVNGEELPFRAAVVAQTNEIDPDRRAAIEAARLAAVEAELNPLLVEAHERAATVVRELGWPSVRALCEDLGGLDLATLGRQAEDFLRSTEDAYEPVVGPELERQLGFGLDRLRRSDIAAFMRAPAFDSWFPAGGALTALERTLAGLGVARGDVHVDAEERPSKSPRAFCAAVRVPDDVHLVIPSVGGREDFDTLFHEAGHAWHYANVDRELPFEERYLGDNGVTEGFAFTFQHLVGDRNWLADVLGVPNAEPLLAHSRAERLLFLRRYCAKLLYELELQGGAVDLDDAPGVYSSRLSDALRVDWPAQTWLADVDSFFYVARYLRAWAFEAQLRRVLSERFGERWFAEPEAGALLRSLWSEGQARTADDLLAELSGERLDLSALAADLVPA